MNTLRRMAAVCAAAAAAWAPTAGVAQSNAQGSAHAISAQDRSFVQGAARAASAEVQASRLALRKALDPQVKKFAQRMLHDHSQVHDRLTRLAQQKGLRIPADLTVAQESKLDILQSAVGREFDNQYTRDFGVSAHENALDIFDKEAQAGRDRELKSFANRTIGKLQEDLRLARNMQAGIDAGAVGASDNATSPMHDQAGVPTKGGK
jgi:putative membrane protein